MSNPTVSFRISDYHLARGLRAIRQIEPDWKMTTTSNLIRTIFNDYIAKSEHTNNMPLAVTPELLQEIALARIGASSQDTSLANLDTIKPLTQRIKTPKEIEDERIFNEIKREAAKAKEIEQLRKHSTDQEITKQIKLMHKAPIDQPTDSKISTVKDFSPPKDWMDKE